MVKLFHHQCSINAPFANIIHGITLVFSCQSENHLPSFVTNLEWESPPTRRLFSDKHKNDYGNAINYIDELIFKPSFKPFKVVRN